MAVLAGKRAGAGTRCQQGVAGVQPGHDKQAQAEARAPVGGGARH